MSDDTPPPNGVRLIEELALTIDIRTNARDNSATAAAGSEGAAGFIVAMMPQIALGGTQLACESCPKA
jgi:hypothetical protein